MKRRQGQASKKSARREEPSTALSAPVFDAAVPHWALPVAVFVIWAAAFAAFSNSFTIAFQFDDLHTVQSNIYIRSLSYIPRYFVDATTYSYRPENSGYRPMASLACALAFQLSHNGTWGFHLVKLLEHCLIATLIMLTALKLLPRTGAVAETPGARFLAAFFAGLIFAVHRANTETVDYITAISTMQAGLFVLLGFYLYVRRGELAPGARRRVYFALSVLCYEAAMMSKEEGVTLPAMLFLYDWIYDLKPGETYLGRLRDNWAAWTKRLLPYIGAAALFIALRTAIQPAVADTSRGNIPRFLYLITQFRSWLHYWVLFYWPVELNSDNLAFDFSLGLGDMRVWGALAVHCAVWAAAWRARMKWPFVLFAVAWTYVTVLPASSIFPLVEAVNEHRMYIPFMALSMLSVWLFFSAICSRKAYSVAARRGAAVAVMAVVTAALGAGAYARNQVWQNEISLWEDVYAKNPDSPRALNVLGVALVNAGQYERALPLLERCHKLASGYLPCMVHLSMAYSHYRRYDDGVKILLEGYALNPDYPHINFHLGIYYKEYLGRPDEAIPYLKKVIDVTQGRFFQATLKLAEIYIDKGNYAEAMRLANSVLNIDNSNGDAWATLARAELIGGQADHAGKIVQRLVQAAPEATRYFFDYANWAERTKEYRRALAAFHVIVEREPNSIQGREGMVRVAAGLGDLEMVRQAQSELEALKKKGNWTFHPSLNMVGEKPGESRP